MLSKSIVVLAVVCQINGFRSRIDAISFCDRPSPLNAIESYYPSFLNNQCSQYEVSSEGQEPNPGFPKVHSSHSSRIQLGEIANFVPKGKRPVLQNYQPEKKNAIYTSHVSAPVQNKQTVRLASFIPKAKTIAHTCTCYKTIIRPRVQYHLITVPTIQRFVQTIQRPAFENIRYESDPINCVEWPTPVQKSPVQRDEITIKFQKYQIRRVEVPSPIKTGIVV